MTPSVPVLVLLLVLLPCSTPISYDNVQWGLTGFEMCGGGECMNETMMEDPGTRRSLMIPGRQRYISYAALSANNIPCNRRGQSYYNCNNLAKANPYTRGCSVITRCARDNS